jgi:hypothetical protein
VRVVRTHCDHCSKPLAGLNRWRFCSSVCYRADHRKYRSDRQETRRKRTKCKHCSGALPSLRGKRQSRGLARYAYCSDTCWREYRRVYARDYQRRNYTGVKESTTWNQ